MSGRKAALCRIDMNTLAQEHYSAALTGAPPGYVGSKEGHTLFDIQAAEGDFSTPGIVLFDEIEKASPEVIRTLLSIMEEGQLRLTSGGRSINFRNCLIFMTTNLGSRDLLTPVPANRLLGLFAARGSRPRRTSRRHHQRCRRKFCRCAGYVLLRGCAGTCGSAGCGCRFYLHRQRRQRDTLSRRIGCRGWIGIRHRLAHP